MAVREVFRSFYSEEEAAEMAQLLTNNGIDATIEKTKVVLDKVIIGDGLDPNVHIKLISTEFEKANQVLNEHISSHLEVIEPDYYLHSFSIEELIEIVRKPDEWSNQDVIIARKLLSQKNHLISDQELKKLNEERIGELRRPEPGSPSWIVLGYAIALFFGFAGILFGLYMMTIKKVLPDGSKVLVYNERARKHCIAIVILSVITSLAFLTGRIGSGWRLFYNFTF
jgi:hypothetical protein